MKIPAYEDSLAGNFQVLTLIFISKQVTIAAALKAALRSK